MSRLVHELLHGATARPTAPALVHKSVTVVYEALAAQVESFSAVLRDLGLRRSDRVAIYLPKQPENVIAMFGASFAGGTFVPVNPLLKSAQVAYILRDCSVRVLVTSPERLELIRDALGQCPELHHVVLVGHRPASASDGHLPNSIIDWSDAMASAPSGNGHRVIDTDMAAIMYTSGSTGRPKGVVLSHRNMVVGAESVSSYLENVPEDRLLAVLPFSFDYGLSQLTTAFNVGACVVLMDYLLPRDILTQLARERVTGLAGVPPLWSQLADLPWPAEAVERLRYVTNSGGTMPGATLQKLRRQMPKTHVYLMYGLTEAFRSTYLPPHEIDRKPGSIGKAIPNAEILVVRPDGSPCAAGEPGELVHRGSLVALGYWNDREKTAERFRPSPGQAGELTQPEIAVWSGDTVQADDEGFLYFIGRRDEMIKSSGYRISPTEIEEVAFASGLVADAVAIGAPHPTLGQAIVLVASPKAGARMDDESLLESFRRELPAFMVPARVVWRDDLPRNPNGKYDRSGLATEFKDLFRKSAS